MKIALFSDIHANLPALEAFFADIEKRGVDALYCLGDLVGYNIWPNEIVNEIRKRNIPTIMGNHDEALLHPVLGSDQCSNRALTKALVNDQNQNYLINLPRQLSLSFLFNSGPFKLLMVHGSAKAIDDYMVADYPADEVVHMMAPHAADMLLCGHTHKPFHRVIKDGQRYKHVVNIGSVGKPKDGDARICYALLELDQNTSSQNPETVKVSFKRVPYDVEQAAMAIEKSKFDVSYANALRKGI